MKRASEVIAEGFEARCEGFYDRSDNPYEEIPLHKQFHEVDVNICTKFGKYIMRKKRVRNQICYHTLWAIGYDLAGMLTDSSCQGKGK